MKKGDLLWGAALLGIVAFLAAPPTHVVFVAASSSYPYPMGFLKFAVLASMGELLSIRIVTGEWKKPAGMLWRALLWGVFGMLITLMFVLFDAGATACMEKGYLPYIGGEGSLIRALFKAFFTSALMNGFFGASFMMFHRLTDTWIDKGQGKMSSMLKVKQPDLLEGADLKRFVSFVVFKTLTIFWIPAHTITFMLPPEYRVLMAAMLSICLGVILGIAKKGSGESKKKGSN